MPKLEPGICVECGKSAECLNTSVGWMCHPCFGAALKNDKSVGGVRVYTMPEPGRKVFVIKEPPDTYITIGKVLYAFDRRCDADDLMAGLRKGSYALKAFVEEVEAIWPLRYVLAHPELRLIGIAEKASGPPSGPTEIPIPKL